MAGKTHRAPHQVSNRTSYLIRRLLQDQNLEDLRKGREQIKALRASLRSHKQGHLACLAQVITLLEEKVAADPTDFATEELLLKAREKQERLKPAAGSRGTSQRSKLKADLKSPDALSQQLPGKGKVRSRQKGSQSTAQQRRT